MYYFAPPAVHFLDGLVCLLPIFRRCGGDIHIGARVASVAAPGEVLVSQTVRDLVAGSGLEFEERGPHRLKGVPNEWHLFRAVPS